MKRVAQALGLLIDRVNDYMERKSKNNKRFAAKVRLAHTSQQVRSVCAVVFTVWILN